MTEEIYDDTAIEKTASKHFRKKLDVKQTVVRNVPTSRTSEATLFMTSSNHMYLYIAAEASMILDDVRKITHRMGLEAEEFCPPNGDKHYFDDVGTLKFKSAFPGRDVITENDIRFYRLLAPYNPALVKISAVKNGEIKQFDLDSGQWRHAARFSYRKVTPKE